VPDRLRLAIDAVFNMKQRYAIDENRIYVGGISGGGRAGSMCATAFSDVFIGGGFFICGVNYFRDIPVPDKKNELWPAQFRAPANPLLTEQKRFSRFVLLTGDNDFNLTNTTAVFNSGFLKDGYKYATLLQVPGMGHGLPNAEWFEKGIVALDEPLATIVSARAAATQQKADQQALRDARKPTSAPTTSPARDTPPDPTRDADRLLSLARSYITAGSFPAARLRLEKIISTYPTTPQAREAKTLLEQIKEK